MPCRRERLGGEGGRSGQDGCGEGRGATRGGRRGGGCPPRSARETRVFARAVLVADARAGERAARRSIDRATDEMAAGTVVRGRRTVAEVPSFFMPTSRAAYVLTVDRRADLAPRRGRPRTCAGAEGRCVVGARRQRTGNLSRGKRVTRTTWPDDGSIADAERSGGKARGADLGHAGGAAGEGGGLAGRDGGGGGERGDGGHAWTRARGGSEAMRHVSGERREDRAQRRNSLSRRTEPRKQSVRAITPITSAILAPRYQHPRTFHPVP